MADRVARKDMGKRFRLSTEVRSTLQRNHESYFLQITLVLLYCSIV